MKYNRRFDMTDDVAGFLIKASLIASFTAMVGAFLLGAGLGLSTWATVGLMVLVLSLCLLYILV